MKGQLSSAPRNMYYSAMEKSFSSHKQVSGYVALSKIYI